MASTRSPGPVEAKVVVIFSLLLCCGLPILPLYLWRKGKLSRNTALGLAAAWVALVVVAVAVSEPTKESEPPAAGASDSAPRTPSESPTPTPTPTPVATPTAPLSEATATPAPQPVVDVPELTPRQQWRANAKLNQVVYSALLLDVFAGGSASVAPEVAALTTCERAARSVGLPVRMSRVQGDFGLSDDVAPQQAITAIRHTIANVCPEFRTAHRVQVRQRATAIRKARVAADRERVRKDRERVKKEREARQRERDREKQEQEERENNPPQEYVYYENCSDVEAAGADPIFAGQPGYSSDLDRDGDGVACEG